MRIYLGGASQPSLRKARKIAPSHVYGQTWTPQHPQNDVSPYFLDNGEYVAAQNGEDWDADAWIETLDRVKNACFKPDFVVLPDAYDDARRTMERNEKWLSHVTQRGLTPAWVLQPGVDEITQIDAAEDHGVPMLFVGGDNRWKRAMGSKICVEARKRDMGVHIGNPSGKDGLTWAYRIGADSADTTSILQNGYWHYLEQLEEITEDTSRSPEQSQQSDWAEWTA